MSGRQEHLVETGTGPDEGKLVVGGRAETGPDADDGKTRERRHVLDGAPEHAPEDGGVDAGVSHAVLARGSDEYLPGLAGLRVEGDRLGGIAVGALQIAELDELAPQESGVTTEI